MSGNPERREFSPSTPSQLELALAEATLEDPDFRIFPELDQVDIGRRGFTFRLYLNQELNKKTIEERIMLGFIEYVDSEGFPMIQGPIFGTKEGVRLVPTTEKTVSDSVYTFARPLVRRNRFVTSKVHITPWTVIEPLEVYRDLFAKDTITSVPLTSVLFVNPSTIRLVVKGEESKYIDHDAVLKNSVQEGAEELDNLEADLKAADLDDELKRVVRHQRIRNISSRTIKNLGLKLYTRSTELTEEELEAGNDILSLVG